MTTYKCPVCFYPNMEEPAQDFNICACCGTEFGNDDWSKSHAELRADWIKKGMPWFFENHPEHWSPKRQLALRSSTEAILQVGPIKSNWLSFPHLNRNLPHARTSITATVGNVKTRNEKLTERINADDFAFAS